MYKSIKLINQAMKIDLINEEQQISFENLNKEYEGLSFQTEATTYRSRLAKKTPKKKGYFVVFWDKDKEDKNQAYHFNDTPDYVLVNILDSELKGQFMFPKNILLKQGILRSETSKGKMGIRVYPSWEKDLNSSAKKTQDWQSHYFSDLS